MSGPRWARTIDPLIMSLLFSIYYPVRKSQGIWVIFNINRCLCIYTYIINCSFYVRYSTGLHGFVEILAKKLAPEFISLNILLQPWYDPFMFGLEFGFCNLNIHFTK